MNHSDISFEIGSVNPSGISDEMYYIPKRDISAWPTIEDSFSSADDEEEYVCYDGNFSLKPGKKWHRMYNTQGKGKFTWEYSGETDCKTVVNKATMVYPKINTAGRALAKFSANGDYVFIGKHDGKYYVIGNKDYRATVTPNGDTGDAAGSAKGITLNVECTDTTPLPEYSGNIVLSDGTLNCSTGVFTSGSSLTLTPNSVAFEDTAENATKTATVNVKGTALTAALTVAVVGDSEITCSPASITAANANASAGANITLSFAPTSAGDYAAVLRITSATDSIDVSIPVIGKCISD